MVTKKCSKASAAHYDQLNSKHIQVLALQTSAHGTFSSRVTTLQLPAQNQVLVGMGHVACIPVQRSFPILCRDLQGAIQRLMAAPTFEVVSCHLPSVFQSYSKKRLTVTRLFVVGAYSA